MCKIVCENMWKLKKGTWRNPVKRVVRIIKNSMKKHRKLLRDTHFLNETLWDRNMIRKQTLRIQIKSVIKKLGKSRINAEGKLHMKIE